VPTVPRAGWQAISVCDAAPGKGEYLLCALHTARDYTAAVALQTAAGRADALRGVSYHDY
jgi:hypothetical protein